MARTYADYSGLVIERLLDSRADAKTEFLVVLDQNCDHLTPLSRFSVPLLLKPRYQLYLFAGIGKKPLIVSTWAEHLRQNMRLTLDETKAVDAAWDLHTGDSEPVVRHYLATQRYVRLHDYGFSGRTFGDTSNWSRSRLAPTTSSPAA